MKNILLIISLFYGVLFIQGCGVIQDGEAGLKSTLGKYQKEPLGTGLKLYNPFISGIEKWNVKKQEVKERVNVPSKEGMIVGLDISLIYSTPASSVYDLRTKVGRQYKEVILIPYMRDIIRSTSAGYNVAALYSSEGREKIAAQALTQLSIKTKEAGIIIHDVLLRDVLLPKKFIESIENKMTLEQKSQQKHFELISAKKDAEIEIAKAKGTAQANKIINNSITEGFLRYKWIESLEKGKGEVIYVPTEAGLPILEAKRK